MSRTVARRGRNTSPPRASPKKSTADNNRPGAELRVHAGLVLAEIAEKEKIEVTRKNSVCVLQMLKGQYTDPAMQAELDKPENQRELASRMLSEKTMAVLVGYNATAAKPAPKAAPGSKSDKPAGAGKKSDAKK